MQRSMWQRVVVAAMVVLSLTGVACGKKKAATKKKGEAIDTALHDALPAAIKKAGFLRVGSDIEYPPVESFAADGKTPQGIDVELAIAIARKLGLKLRFENDTDFAGIITALQAGRFDIIMSAMNDTAERRGKGVHFIDYFTAGTSILVAKGNPQHITSLDSLCGKTVAVQKGTTQETDTIPGQQPKCTAAKQPKITVIAPEKATDALLQVKSGRAVAALEDSPVAAYDSKTSGGGNDFQVVGDILDVGRYGIAVPATCANPCADANAPKQLLDAVRGALKDIIADGTYDRVLANFGAQSGALKTAAVDGG